MQTVCKAVASTVAALAAAVAFSSPADASSGRLRYRVEALGLLPGDLYGEAAAINNAGAIVGWSANGNFDGPRQAFLWHDGRLENLGSLGGTYSEALDLNERGDVVGQSSNAAGQKRPFLWRDGRMLDVAAGLGKGEGRGLGINAAGQVVGDFNDRAFHFDGRSSRLLFDDDARSIATAIDDQGTVVGGGRYGLAFVLRDGALSWLPRPVDDFGEEMYGDYYAEDINASGQILVNRQWDYDYYAGAYVYNSDGRWQDTGFFNSGAWTMNNHGWVVGSTADFDPEWGDFVWEVALYRDGSTALLSDLVRPADAAHWRFNDARDINDAGQIVGSGWYDGQFRPFVATPVPEPAQGALLLAGFIAVGATAARRRRAGIRAGVSGAAESA